MKRVEVLLLVLLLGSAALLFWVTAVAELNHYLETDHKQTQALYQQGISFDTAPESLVGLRPTHAGYFRHSENGLLLEEVTRNTQISFRLPQPYIDLNRLNRIQLKLDSSEAGELRLFYRNDTEGPVIRSEGISLEPGLTTLEKSVKELAWSIQERNGKEHSGWTMHIASTDEPEPVSEWVIGLFYDQPADVLLTDFKLLPASVAGQMNIDLVNIDGGFTRSQEGLEKLASEKQTSPATALAHESFAFSLLNFNPWLASSVILLLLVLALLNSAQLASPLSVALYLSALIISVCLTGQYADHGTNRFWLLVPLLAISLPVLIYRQWRRLLPSLSGNTASRISVLMILITLILLLLSPDQGDQNLRHRYFTYLPWALFQQLVLCGGLYQLCTRLYRMQTSHMVFPIVIASILFGWLHYPNLELMMATSLLGLLCIVLYRRGQDILTLGLLHALAGALALTWLTPDWFHSGEIGLAFFKY